LTASVLVLNRLYLAVHVVGARRAFALLCRELVEVIHFEEGALATYTFDMWREASKLRANSKQPHEDWVRAVNFEIQVPRVVRLLTYDRLPRQHVHLNRRSVLARDGHQCQYCGRHFPIQQLSLDHVLPRSRGGTTTWENVVCACLGCNVRKGGRTPHEAKMTLICRPTKPRRNPLLLTKLNNPKYESWRTWLDGVYWDIGARD
jgi:5-methylcytosine-specific restriction endonuclease McrA